MSRFLGAVLLVAASMLGCTGVIEAPGGPSKPTGPNDPSNPGDPFAFACAGPAAAPSISVVSKLDRARYVNTVGDLFGHAFDAQTLATMLAVPQVKAALDAVPPDGVPGHSLVFDTQDQNLSPVLVNAHFEFARAAGDWLTADAARLATFVRAFAGPASCANVMATGCVDAFIAGFGLRTLRRPLDPADDDAAFYRSTYDTLGGYRGVIISLLMAPGFLFVTEFKGTAVSERDDLSQLSSYEVASRLSYSLTNTMPDEALFAAAAAGFTGAGNTVPEQIERLRQSQPARGQYASFFRQWLRVERIPELTPSLVQPALALSYPDRAGTALPANTDLSKLRTDAFEELLDLTDYHLFGVEQTKLGDLFTSDISFARSADLAKIYGVAPWEGRKADGSYDASKLVRFPAGERAGLFTRAAFAFSGNATPNPIIRGARIRTEYLCDALAPPANVNTPAEVVMPQHATTREQMAAKTQTSGTACAGCHVAKINPLGFGFEHYDALGRYRAQQQVFDTTTGEEVGWAAVDSSSVPRIDALDATASVKSGVELSAALAGSGKLSACFVRNYFRYFVGRQETAEDGCLLEQMRQSLIDPATGSLQQLVRALPRTRELGLRRIAKENQP